MDAWSRKCLNGRLDAKWTPGGQMDAGMRKFTIECPEPQMDTWRAKWMLETQMDAWMP